MNMRFLVCVLIVNVELALFGMAIPVDAIEKPWQKNVQNLYVKIEDKILVLPVEVQDLSIFIQEEKAKQPGKGASEDQALAIKMEGLTYERLKLIRDLVRTYKMNGEDPVKIDLRNDLGQIKSIIVDLWRLKIAPLGTLAQGLFADITRENVRSGLIANYADLSNEVAECNFPDEVRAELVHHFLRETDREQLLSGLYTDLKSHDELFSFVRGPLGTIVTIGKRAQGDYALDVWDSASQTRVYGCSMQHCADAFFCKGPEIGLLSADRFRILNAINKKISDVPLLCSQGADTLYAMALSPGSTIAVGSGNAIFFYDIQTKAVHKASHDTSMTELGHGDRLQFTPDGSVLIEFRNTGTICFWDVAQRKCIAYEAQHKQRVALATYTKEGNLVSYDESGLICWWDSKNKTIRKTLKISQGKALCFDNYGERLLCRSIEGVTGRSYAKVLTLLEGKEESVDTLFMPESDAGNVVTGCFNAEPRGSFDSRIALATEGKKIHVFSKHGVHLFTLNDDSITKQLNFSLSGSSLIALHPDKVRLWHLDKELRGYLKNKISLEDVLLLITMLERNAGDPHIGADFANLLSCLAKAFTDKSLRGLIRYWLEYRNDYVPAHDRALFELGELLYKGDSELLVMYEAANRCYKAIEYAHPLVAARAMLWKAKRHFLAHYYEKALRCLEPLVLSPSEKASRIALLKEKKARKCESSIKKLQVPVRDSVTKRAALELKAEILLFKAIELQYIDWGKACNLFKQVNEICRECASQDEKNGLKTSPKILGILGYLTLWGKEGAVADRKAAREYCEQAIQTAEPSECGMAYACLGDIYMWAYGVEKNYQLAQKYFLEALKSDIPWVKHFVSFWLANIYVWVDGKIDYAKAYKLFSFVADETTDLWLQAGAWYWKGDMNLWAKHVTENFEEALRLLKKAQGQYINGSAQANANYLLGFMQLHGKGIPVNHKEAHALFEKVLEQRESYPLYGARLQLGRMHRHGWGCEIDKEKAKALFQMVADQVEYKELKEEALLELISL